LYSAIKSEDRGAGQAKTAIFCLWKCTLTLATLFLFTRQIS